MAKTPEGRIKDQVKAALHRHKVLPFLQVEDAPEVAGTYYMPVAGPYSVHGVHDFVGCWASIFFSIETKAVDNPSDETVHQGKFRVAITRTGGIALTGVRDGEAAVRAIAELVKNRLTSPWSIDYA